ncbi:MAG: hypothetical protein AABX11_02885 [Nanoarchaeota archaeon]
MNEEKIIKYKGYSVNFRVLPKTKDFLDKVNIDLIGKDRGTTDSEFFEVELFEIIDEDKDGLPDEKFGKKFEVVYYGIIEQWVKKEPMGFFEDFSHNPRKLLCDAQLNLFQIDSKKPFGVKYKILKK